MTPAHGASSLLGPLLGSAHGGLMVTAVPFLTGIVVAGAVISLLRQEQPRIAARLRASGENGSDKTLEELIAEKEHLEDLIAEAAAKQSGR